MVWGGGWKFVGKYRLVAVVVATGRKVRVCETLAFTAKSTPKW